MKTTRAHRLNAAFGMSLCLAGVLFGCESAEHVDSAVDTSAAVSAVPVATSYAAAVVVHNGVVQSSIALDAPAHWYRRLIDAEELQAIRGHDALQKFQPRWRYMGTRDGVHHLIREDSLVGILTVYRIAAEEIAMPDPVALTSERSKWKDLRWDWAMPAQERWNPGGIGERLRHVVVPYEADWVLVPTAGEVVAIQPVVLVGPLDAVPTREGIQLQGVPLRDEPVEIQIQDTLDLQD